LPWFIVFDLLRLFKPPVYDAEPFDRRPSESIG
jgi:hypothetical protein